MTVTKQKGLLVINTGDGKGKSTAAFGMVLRAWGRGLRVGVIQFIKSKTGKWGEVRAAQQMGVDWTITGDGFTWTSKDLDESAARFLDGWEIAKEKISSGEFDLIVLDEFTYGFKFGWLEISEALNWLEENRPPALHLVITGRDAPEQLIEKADIVTEMKVVKHPFDQGITAQPGIEF